MSGADSQVWGGMLAHLRANRQPICRLWFEEIEPLGISGGALNLRAQSAIHRDYLKRQCADAFNDAARTVSGRLLSVRFLGPQDPLILDQPPARAGANGRKPRPQRPASEIVEPKAQSLIVQHETPRYESLIINPDCSFENFVVGPGNRLAHAAAVAVSTNPGKSYNPYFIHSGVGLGKTHLLQAICLRVAQTSSSLNMLYISCEGFVTQFMESVQSGEMGQFRHRFRDVDLLVIDDIHFLAKRDRTQEEFFHTFNTLYQANKQIILSSDAAPEEIPDLEARLVSRFKWGLVAKLEPPCFETRVAILKTKARLRGVTMPDNVAEFISARINTNIRELEGAIGTLQNRSDVEKRAIDLDMAKAALGEAPVNALGEPTIQVITEIVTEFYGVKVTDLQSKRRQRSVALPRQVCMFLARKHTRMSLEEIGGYFGGRDHTTVMHAIRTVEERRQPESEFEAVIKSLEERVRPQRVPT